jgi:hypothetical protein
VEKGVRYGYITEEAALFKMAEWVSFRSSLSRGAQSDILERTRFPNTQKASSLSPTIDFLDAAVKNIN